MGKNHDAKKAVKKPKAERNIKKKGIVIPSR